MTKGSKMEDAKEHVSGDPRMIPVRDAILVAAAFALVVAAASVLVTRSVMLDSAGILVARSGSEPETVDEVRAALVRALDERRGIDTLIDQSDAEIEGLSERYNRLVQSDGGDASEPPADDPSLPRDDARGRSPEDAVLALVDARNRRDWGSLYSLYATPEVDPETMKREFQDAAESYEEFRVLEERVIAPDAAFVRVAYVAVTTPSGGSPYPIVVDDPGEWWPVHKVDGLWKTQWMPRQ